MSACARIVEARCSHLGGNPNPRAMQRRFAAASEEGSGLPLFVALAVAVQ
jgi:hypothetical protein